MRTKHFGPDAGVLGIVLNEIFLALMWRFYVTPNRKEYSLPARRQRAIRRLASGMCRY